METRAHYPSAVAISAPLTPVFYFLFSLFCCFAVWGCAAPGDPTPPRPPVPAAIADLTARQSGDGVALVFTLPKTTVDSLPLAEPPAIEIFRGFLPARVTPAPAAVSKNLVYTIPSALVDTYEVEGRIRFLDPLRPEEMAKHAGEQAVYVVRTRASKKKDSAESNLVAVRVYPAPEAIRDVVVTVTQQALELSWTPPEKTSAGAPLPPLAGYRVYRAEIEPGAEAVAAADTAKAKLVAPLAIVGVTPAAAYRDVQFEFGRTYLYAVRSVAQYESEAVESADSRLVVVTPRDTFPPAPPRDLVITAVPAMAQAPAHLELSWGISPETDVAGYNVYRSEPGGRGERLNRELLLTPAFRDMSAVPGRRYLYTVTATDRAGNESQPSVAVEASAPDTGEEAKP